MEGLPAIPEESASMDIVTRIQAGDEPAWGELYKRYHDQLLFTVRMRLGSSLRTVLESEDVFQSVALDAFKALQRFEYQGPGSLERFLKKMVLNKIRERAKYFGAQKRAGGVALDVNALGDLAAASQPGLQSAANAGPEYHAAETYGRLERAIASLPQSMREVLLLRKVEGLTSAEVAAQLGKSDAAVRKLASRAMARVAAAMAEADSP